MFARQRLRHVVRGALRGASRGLTILEALFVVAILATMIAIGLPLFQSAIDEHRTASAARYLAGRLALARMEAVKRSVRVGLRFEGQDAAVRYAAYADGNDNGIRTADIARGVDWPLSPAERIGDLFPGVVFAIDAAVPEIDGGEAAGDGRDPLRIGRSGIVTFTPIGTATSGTLYLRGRGRTQFAVRVLGVTGRTRVLRFDSGSRQWIAR